MRIKVSLVSSPRGAWLAGGLRSDRPREHDLFEVYEVPLADARDSPSQLVGSHLLVFALGEDDPTADLARDIAAGVRMLYDLPLPVLVLGGHPGYPSPGAHEEHLPNLDGSFWTAIMAVVQILVRQAHPRLIVIDDNLDELVGLPVPIAVVGGSPRWIFPIQYLVAFDRRHGSVERQVRECVRALSASESAGLPTCVVIDILLGSAQEGRALAIELLLTDGRTRVYPISGQVHQREFDDTLGLLARAFPGRLAQPTRKRTAGLSWPGHLDGALAAKAVVAASDTGSGSIQVSPFDSHVALRAALLTLLASGLPFIVSGLRSSDLLFTQVANPQPVSAAITGDLLHLDPTLAGLPFTSTWNPDDLQRRALDDTDPLARFLTAGPMIVRAGLSPISLRDLMVDAVRGLRAPAWRPTSMAAARWVEVLLDRYRPPYSSKVPAGPFTSVLDKQHSENWLAQHWSTPALEGIGSLANNLARRFHGCELDDRDGSGPDRFHAMAVALLIWASLELVRAICAAAKADQETQISQRLQVIAHALPVMRGSVWAVRGRGAIDAPHLDEVAFRALVGRLKSISPKLTGPPWVPGPEPFEILVQMTLRML